MAELRVKGTGTIKLFENDNTSSVTIASPASLGGDRTVTLPDADVTLVSGTMNDATALSGTVPIGSGGTGATTLAGAGLTNAPAFEVYLSAAQSVSSGVTTKITFDTEVFDTNSAFASNKFTVPADEGGKYLFILWCHVANTATDAASQNLFLYKNGASVWQANCHFAANTIKRLLMAITWIDDASATDYFEGYASVSGTSPSVLGGTGSFGSFFGGYKLIGI